MIRQVPTGTAHLYVAVVLVPADVRDPSIGGSGEGTGPTIALFTAWAGRDSAVGQMIACTLAPAQKDICAASLRFFLLSQSRIRTGISAANLARMAEALTALT